MVKDGYEEQIIKTKPRTLYTTLMTIGIIMIILGVITFLFTAFGLTIIFVGIVLTIIGTSKRGCEFEYIMVNDDIEIARITAKSSRKQVYHFTNGDVKLIAKSDSIYIDNEHQVNANIKIKDFTSKDNSNSDNIYAFILNKNNETEEVLLQLSEKTLNHVNIFFKGKIKE